MEFVKLLSICHPESATLANNVSIYCNICQKVVIPCIFQYIRQPFQDHLYGAALAQAFYEWTGNDQVPLPFTVVDVDGVLSQRVTGQSLRHVAECIQILRAINAPFTTESQLEQRPEMGTFMMNFLKSVRFDPLSREEQMLSQMIRGVQQVLEADKEFANPFELYFSKLVPYTQQCVSDWQPFQAQPPDPNGAKELWIQLYRSNVIRNKFGMYCIPFDAIHVMVGAFTCCSDTAMVCNWVLDLVVRICRGHYFWKRYPDCLFVKTVNQVLGTHVTRRNHMALYQTMRQFRDGNAVDCLPNLWTHYLQLVKLVHLKFNVPHTTYDVNEMACQQVFPAVLFEDHGDFYGFILSSTHLMMSVEKNALPKGAFKKARHIYKIVQKFVKSVSEFHQSNMVWTLDTLKLFMLANPNLEDEIKEVTQVLLTEEE